MQCVQKCTSIYSEPYGRAELPVLLRTGHPNARLQTEVKNLLHTELTLMLLLLVRMPHRHATLHSWPAVQHGHPFLFLPSFLAHLPLQWQATGVTAKGAATTTPLASPSMSMPPNDETPRLMSMIGYAEREQRHDEGNVHAKTCTLSHDKRKTDSDSLTGPASPGKAGWPRSRPAWSSATPAAARHFAQPVANFSSRKKAQKKSLNIVTLPL